VLSSQSWMNQTIPNLEDTMGNQLYFQCCSGASLSCLEDYSLRVKKERTEAKQNGLSCMRVVGHNDKTCGKHNIDYMYLMFSVITKLLVSVYGAAVGAVSILGMGVFLRNISFHGVLLDALFEPGNRDWQKVHSLVSNGILDGTVKPLQTTVFDTDDIEGAFRFMAQGKHIGKVLIKVCSCTCWGIHVNGKAK